MTVERRTLIKGTVGGALAAGPFAGFTRSAAAAAGDGPPVSLGELMPIPDETDGVVRLHLPRQFRYRSFHNTAKRVVLKDGTVLPGRHDGMGSFQGPGDTTILVRNHEVNNPMPAFGPSDVEPYDAMAGGGTTTVVVNDKNRRLVRSFTSLSGTMMNCSGGEMPWKSWVSCEETVNGPDVGPDFTGASNVALQKPHGYVFEVPARASKARGRSNNRPIRHAGRFAHEAVSYDPVDGFLYLTEDNFAFPSGFYRYKPPSHPSKAGRLADGGTLQMLKVKGSPRAHLEANQRTGETYDVVWVDIDEPDFLFDYTPGEEATTSNDTAINFVGRQGRRKGGALFSRCEGQVFDDGVVYFTSTQGGGAPEDGPDGENGFGNGWGQVWGYDCRSQRLRCVYQSRNRRRLDFPDNITTSPRGTLVVCEDHDERNYLRGLTQEGEIWSIARNATKGRTDDEFAGSTFSPDGRTLYVNIQASEGLTFAIWGPWRSIGV
jgi:secreted PhoX family phosphatase